MVATEPAVTIKPPRTGMVLVLAWMGFLCLVIVAGAASEHDARALFLVFVWLPWLIPVVLFARSRLTAAGEILTCRGTACLSPPLPAGLAG
jgi:hypothetical protein